MIGGSITAHKTLCPSSCYFEQLGTSLLFHMIRVVYFQDKEARLQKLKNQIKRDIEEEESKLRKEKEGSIK